MRYEKPAVVDLGAGARADGQENRACIVGAAATGDETCHAGSSAGFTCNVGTAGPAGATCIPGNSPGGGFEDCISGSAPFYCISGAGGNVDPAGCNFGPSVA